MNLDFTEWDYGAGQAVSGAIATADVLGIFGRYGVHAAAFWALSSDEAFAYAAFAMYRDYNGHGAGFGDTEVSATTTDEVSTSVYASIEKADPRHVVIIVINKSLNPTTATVRLQGVTAANASTYTLTSKISKPEPAPALVATNSGNFTYLMPAQSVSVIVPRTGT
jgi:O-glycosyl hydrolase